MEPRNRRDLKVDWPQLPAAIVLYRSRTESIFPCNLLDRPYTGKRYKVDKPVGLPAYWKRKAGLGIARPRSSHIMIRLSILDNEL